MRLPLFAAALTLLACGTPSGSDAGTNSMSDAGTDAGTCAASAWSGAWNVTGTVTKNGPTWPVSFPMTVTVAADCTAVTTTDGECAFTWHPQSSTSTTATISSATVCSPGAHTTFTFDGMQVFNGTTDPFPGTTLDVTIDAGTMTGNATMLTISGTGSLGARTSGSEPMSFSYTATR